MKLDGIPDYARLDASGEAIAAAERMEARAAEPASAEMFDALVRPLLTPAPRRVLEVGCGPGALARRIAEACPSATVLATDKSRGMIAVAEALASRSPRPNLRFAPWDVVDGSTFPGEPPDALDLIVSSVMVPYLPDAAVAHVIGYLAARLARGGTLAFIEQDLQTDAVWFPDYGLLARVLAKDARPVRASLALGLRPLIEHAGLVLRARRSFLWTEDHYGPYLRDLLGRMAEDAAKAGRLSADEVVQWKQTLDALASRGHFHYGIVYHLISATRR